MLKSLKNGRKNVKIKTTASSEGKEVEIKEPTQFDLDFWNKFNFQHGVSTSTGITTKPPYNFNSSPTNQNLTRMIMKDPSVEDYFETQKMLGVILYLSPEPRLYSNSIHLQNQKIIFKQSTI